MRLNKDEAFFLKMIKAIFYKTTARTNNQEKVQLIHGKIELIICFHHLIVAINGSRLSESSVVSSSSHSTKVE